MYITIDLDIHESQVTQRNSKYRMGKIVKWQLGGRATGGRPRAFQPCSA